MRIIEQYQQGQCSRCDTQGPVVIEVGPQAENVCKQCLKLQREQDYAEYQRLMAADMDRGNPLYA